MHILHHWVSSLDITILSISRTWQMFVVNRGQENPATAYNSVTNCNLRMPKPFTILTGPWKRSTVSSIHSVANRGLLWVLSCCLLIYLSLTPSLIMTCEPVSGFPLLGRRSSSSSIMPGPWYYHSILETLNNVMNYSSWNFFYVPYHYVR